MAGTLASLKSKGFDNLVRIADGNKVLEGVDASKVGEALSGIKKINDFFGEKFGSSYQDFVSGLINDPKLTMKVSNALAVMDEAKKLGLDEKTTGNAISLAMSGVEPPKQAIGEAINAELEGIKIGGVGNLTGLGQSLNKGQGIGGIS